MRKPNSCNNNIYHFHASELLNLIFGCPRGATPFPAHLDPSWYNYDVQSNWAELWLAKIVTLLDFRNVLVCNNHIYNFHVSELLNLSFG